MAATTSQPRWWQKDATPGYVLLAAAAISFILLNSPAAESFDAFLHAPVGLTLGPYVIDSYVRGMVKDALMAVFFLYVGLELKRECIEGPFRSVRTAALPALGALGGMVAPALIYLFVATEALPTSSAAYAPGWAIPSATDIAFAVGVISLLGNRIPSGMRLFLLAVAIVDDLGAILIIAFFYSAGLDYAALGVSGAIFGLMLALPRLGVRGLTAYWVLGVVLWGAMAKTGMSPTLAGVLTAMAVPMRSLDGKSPLVAAEHALKGWVQLGIMPVFALAMAGAPLAGVTLDAFLHPLALGIALGLLVGKPLGIGLLTYAGGKLLRQPLPGTLPQLVGLGLIAGIGFTMSLFIGSLAFADPALQVEVRLGVIGGSVAAAGLGLLLLSLVTSKHSSVALHKQEELAEDRGVLEDRD